MTAPVGIIQITSQATNPARFSLLKDRIVPALIDSSEGNYTLVSPPNEELRATVTQLGGQFKEYTGWEVDKNRKFREGIPQRQEAWVAFLDDDILPDEEWMDSMKGYLEDKAPGQYGFRLTDDAGSRHEFGEDWMQFASPKFGLRHRGLKYDVATGYIEQSPTAYVSNSFIHKDVFNYVQPFGLFGKAPDVSWCFAIKQAGFPVGFNVHARAYHLGDRKDNR
tara:strand:+ start:668 stop:1333 length:666 start_codon:yes stop_codon:yes gene_type:complete